jgi:type II secretory ATPase GspE/PulE/Tfp pilus assembly ATPase PilB-like protein
MTDGVDENAPIVRIAYTIIQQAIVDKASEILVEPAQPGQRVSSYDGSGPSRDVERSLEASRETGAQSGPKEPFMRVAVKVGKAWRDLMPLPDYVREPIIDRFKEMADMDLTCRDKCQDGRIPIRYANRPTPCSSTRYRIHGASKY